MSYGRDPKVLGKLQLQPSEMCFVQYLPITMPEFGGEARVPANLCWAKPIIKLSLRYASLDKYIYLTVKHLWVTPDNIGNRHGWHTDGFGSDDLNIIWSDKYPTEFCVQDFTLSSCHEKSMQEMEEQAKPENILTYPEGSVILLDKWNVHRPPVIQESGFRTFVKVSISKEKYNLRGNAHNCLFPYNWGMHNRQVNHVIIQ
jgi:hypothetical protein